MKIHWMISILAVLALATACVSDEPADDALDLQAEVDTSSGEQAVTASPLVAEWYYTCSNEILACRIGYGAVEWIRNHPSCLPKLYRVKCQRGAIDP